jgi:hypothetical protein
MSCTHQYTTQMTCFHMLTTDICTVERWVQTFQWSSHQGVGQWSGLRRAAAELISGAGGAGREGGEKMGERPKIRVLLQSVALYLQAIEACQLLPCLPATCHPMDRGVYCWAVIWVPCQLQPFPVGCCSVMTTACLSGSCAAPATRDVGGCGPGSAPESHLWGVAV